MCERDELVARLRGICLPTTRDAADHIERDGREIERLAAEGNRLSLACFRQEQQISGQAMTIKKLTEDRDFWRDQFQVETRARIGLREALAWYGEQAQLARLIHSGGDAGRLALAADGGGRARAALNGVGET